MRRRRCHSAPVVRSTVDVVASRKSRLRQIKIGMMHRKSQSVAGGFHHYILTPDFPSDLLPIPDVDAACSKRCWDSQIRVWRRLLHVYDDPSVVSNRSAVGFPLVQHQALQVLSMIILYKQTITRIRAECAITHRLRSRSIDTQPAKEVVARHRGPTTLYPKIGRAHV